MLYISRHSEQMLLSKQITIGTVNPHGFRCHDTTIVSQVLIALSPDEGTYVQSDDRTGREQASRLIK